MSKSYSKEMLDIPADGNFKVIIIFNDNDIAVGTLVHSKYAPYELLPLTINESSRLIRRSDVKKLIYLKTGFILPKTKDGPHKILNILDLNELVNKAGYEFI